MSISPYPANEESLCQELVSERFNNAQSYADAAHGAAIVFLDELSALSTEAPIINTDITFDEQELTLDTSITNLRPDRPDMSMTDYSSPDRPDINDVTVDTLNAIPGFDVPDLVITFPEQPSDTEVGDPGEPPAIDDAVFPATPAYTLPAVPSLREANIPEAPNIVIPIFDEVMPIDDLVLPVGNLNFTDSPYASDLLDDLKKKLHDNLRDGGTGLGADIETAIWDREAERALAANLEAKAKLSDEIAAAGWSLPDGVLLTAHLDIEREYLNQRITSGRDIAIKQAELAQTNTHFIMQQVAALEQGLMTYASAMADRALKAATAAIEFSISLFNAQVTKYNAKLEAYKTVAIVYETRIKAALSQIEIFKAQIEGQKLILQVNSNEVEIYKAQLAGVDALINIYKTEMQAAAIRTDTEKLKIDAFRAKVEAYTARVQLHVARFNMYDSAIKGESVKAEVYGKRVDAYKSRVEAAKVEADLVLARAKISMDLESFKMEIYKADIEAYKVEIQAEATRIGAIVDAYKGDVDMYKADASVEDSILTNQVKLFAAKVDQATAQANLYMKEAEIQLGTYNALQNLKVEITKAGAAVAAQLAASALAGVNASASLGDSMSQSNNWSQSNSVGITASTSQSNSDSTSHSTQYIYEMD